MKNYLCKLLFFVSFFSNSLHAGAYIFAGDGNGLDSITHPTGYTGSGGVVTLTVGIDPASTKTTELVTSIKNNINIWNELNRTTGNLITGASNNIPSNAIDFESVALHEMGHCIGLAHVNLASESGFSDSRANYTKSTDGADNSYSFDDGGDNVIGSSDDQRGDDINLFWFKKSDNDPFSSLPAIIDSTTYSRNLADLPVGHSFATNGDRGVSTLLGISYSEAIMQQGSSYDEAQRTLTADGVATMKLAQAGKDEIQGNADDYTINLQYAGITSSADLVVHFEDIGSGLAYCTTGGAFLSGSDHIRITTANLYFDDDSYNWFFNPESNGVINGSCGSSHNSSFTSTPVSNLCLEGNAGSVTGVGPWSWSCNGVSGGTNSNCNGAVYTSGSCDSNAAIIGPLNYNSGTITESSQKSIATNGTVTVQTGVSVVYQAPSIVLNTDFSAESGASFTATASAVSCSPEVLVLNDTSQAESEASDDLVISSKRSTYIEAQNNMNLAPDWLSRKDIPSALDKLIGDNKIVEIQTDAMGIYIIFSSTKPLLKSDTNPYSDIYLYHTLSDSLTLVSTAIEGNSANSASTQAKINGAGNYVVYRSEASNINIFEDDTNQVADIYLYNIDKEKNYRISVNADGSQTSYASSNPSIANNFPYVVYDKQEAEQQHVYSTNLDKNSNILSDKQSQDFNTLGERLDNKEPNISSDGRYISYKAISQETDRCTIQLIDLKESETTSVECTKANIEYNVGK